MAFDFPNAPTLGQTYQGWVYDGEKWVSIIAPSAPNQSGVISIQVFTASGQYTPSANMTTCVIECVGGGGGGGGAANSATGTVNGAGGGGGGGYAKRLFTATAIGIAQAIVIGTAGTAGVAGNNTGGAGTDTTFGGTLCVGKGATGGGGAADSAAGNGGSSLPGTGDFTTAGQPGTAGRNSNIATVFMYAGGAGGNSAFGWGGTLTGAGLPGKNATGYGGGGSGASCWNNGGAFVGGAGASGLVVVTEYGMTALSPATAQLGSVRYDLPQGLTANQTAQARANIQVTKKNYIINGAMQISQENGAAGGNANLYYPVDQFYITFVNSATVTVHQYAVATPAGSPTRTRVLVNTADAAVAATDFSTLVQNIEGTRVADLRFGTASAKTITLQFGVRAPAGTYCVAVGNATSNRTYISEYTVAAGEANTDVVKSVTVPGDTAGTWTADNTSGIRIYWCLMAGTTYQQAAGSWGTANAFGSANQFNFIGTINNEFHLFDVSLTEGNVAPPFQVPDYASELALCKRYWWKSFNHVVDTNAISQTFMFGFEMRIAPTITGGGTGFTIAAGNPYGAQVYQTARAYQTLLFNARL